MQTPVLTYRNAHQTVTVAATCHVGTADYYKDLLAVITTLESQGATVLYEMTTPAPDEQWAAATDEERHARDVMNAGKDDQGGIWDLVVGNLGWTTQHDLPYPPSWRNADLTDLEIIRRAGAGTVARAFDRRTASQQRTDETRAGQYQAIMLTMIRVEAAWPPLAQLIGAATDTRAHRRLGRVIGQERSDHAIRMIPGDTDAVLVWGYGHLAEMDVGLRAAAFSCSSVAWLDVGKLPSRPN
jgi:hypothetical protein